MSILVLSELFLYIFFNEAVDALQSLKLLQLQFCMAYERDKQGYVNKPLKPNL